MLQFAYFPTSSKHACPVEKTLQQKEESKGNVNPIGKYSQIEDAGASVVVCVAKISVSIETVTSPSRRTNVTKSTSNMNHDTRDKFLPKKKKNEKLRIKYSQKDTKTRKHLPVG